MSYGNVRKDEAQEQITIFVETLTGKTFEVKISIEDQVKTIKRKIQKVEGIPISHQHLLYNSKELEDSSCVTEPSVALHDCARVKLILSMKGGPISLFQHPFGAASKGLLKYNKDLEKLPPGCKMSLLVLRIGDQLNLLHVVENVDESYDSLYDDTVYLSNFLEGESSKTTQENSVTKEKVCDLKERMGNLFLQRKALKANSKKEEINLKTQLDDLPLRLDNSLKLPALMLPVNEKAFKSRSHFSKVPILPDIVSQPYKSFSRDKKLLSLDKEDKYVEICRASRPKTCPAVSEDQFGNNLIDRSCQSPLQISRSHYRSCVSALGAHSSKIRHTCGERTIVLQSFNNLPPINSASERVLNNRTRISHIEDEKRQSTKVTSLSALNFNQRSLSSFKLKQGFKKESLALLNGSESDYVSNIGYNSETAKRECLNGYSHQTTSHRTELFSRATQSSRTNRSAMDSAHFQQLNNKTYDSSLESSLNNKRPNLDKKGRVRCSECNKRLSLTNSFECRCGLSFCSYHRYSETHHCSYDFKKESRKMLEQSNPSVVAPKLPKM